VSLRLLKALDQKSGSVSNGQDCIASGCAHRVSAAVSGGFATVHPNNRLTINAVEAAPLEDFSLEVRS
jgi:F0F1-type ATP synthase epsilon subunit